MDSDKKELISLIESSEVVDFAPFGEGCSPSWIEKTELALGLRLPESYKWWLSNYSGGEVAGREIFSIYELDDVVGGDILYMANTNSKNYGFSPNEKLYVMESGHHSAYFDTSNGSADEYEVIEDWDGEVTHHKNFILFLIDLIKKCQ